VYIHKTTKQCDMNTIGWKLEMKNGALTWPAEIVGREVGRD